MPSTATITAFYNFTANTKARATHVNINFDAFRGHIIPINPNTSTAIHNTYDLGSSEYLWRNLYVGNVRKPAEAGTTTASAGQFALSGLFSVNFQDGGATTGADVSNSTITLSTIGRPVEISFIPNNSTIGGIVARLSSTYNTTTSKTCQVYINLMRNGVTASTQEIFFREDYAFATSGGLNIEKSFTIPFSSIKFIDTPSATTNIYSINISKGYFTIASFFISYGQLYAIEK